MNRSARAEPPGITIAAPSTTGRTDEASRLAGVGSVCWIDKIDQAFCDALHDPAIAGAAATADMFTGIGMVVREKKLGAAGRG